MHPIPKEAVEAPVAQHSDPNEPGTEAVGPFPLADDREEDLELRAGGETLTLGWRMVGFIGDGRLNR
jgi:hypothetical protein